MNIQSSGKALIRWFSSLRQRISSGWTLFTFSPALYWNKALAFFAILLAVMLISDLFIFWKLSAAPQDFSDAPAEEFSLEHAVLKTALAFLDERRKRFDETEQTGTSTLRNIFSPLPPAGLEQATSTPILRP